MKEVATLLEQKLMERFYGVQLTTAVIKDVKDEVFRQLKMVCPPSALETYCEFCDKVQLIDIECRQDQADGNRINVWTVCSSCREKI